MHCRTEYGKIASPLFSVANSNGTAPAETLDWMLCAVQMAVKPANVSRRACALAAVTVAVENACAASCNALAKAAEWGKKAGVSQQSGSRLPSRQNL